MSDMDIYTKKREAWGYFPRWTIDLANAPVPAPHLGHTKHLCYMVESGVDIDSYKRLVKDATFICQKCGRAAAKAENLCTPWPLGRKLGDE